MQKVFTSVNRIYLFSICLFPQVKPVIKARPLRLLTILNLTFAIMKMLMNLWLKATEQLKESIFC
ncbi:Uncharacterised protein [Streptococcus pneumoniae]|nr:Uncharacterised protein [Streptococcus pneumoniae]